jgi:hypothetical protein
MLSLNAFVAMNETEQANIVWEGTYLGNRLEGQHMVQLYSVSTFFVEVFYDMPSNCISRLRPFKSTRLLEPYLTVINL